MTDLRSNLRVKNITLRNRLVMPPMTTNKATHDGEVTKDLIKHYNERAKYPGMIIVEHSYVDPGGKLSVKQLGIHDDDKIPGLRKLSESIYEKGCIPCIQITHSGGACDPEIIGKTPVSSSSDWYAGKDVKSLNIEEMQDIKECFRDAARRAKDAGFPAVEVHGAHGFLLNQFASPLTNRRDDDYGGTRDKILKFPLEVVESVKNEIGEMVLMYRMGACDEREDGFSLEHAKYFGKKLENAGVDIIDVSGGLCGSRPERYQGEQGYYVPYAEEVKKSVNLPVIGVGGIIEPEFADSLVREERVDLVAVGRAMLKDPEWGSELLR